MKSKIILTIAASLANFTLSINAATTTASNLDVSLMQMYSVAPNFVATSPSWNNYVGNMLAGTSMGGFSSSGDPTSPGYFTNANDMLINGRLPLERRAFSTGGGREFNSWLGQTNPGDVFGPAFANETGSQLHSPFLLLATDGPITITSITIGGFSVIQNGGADPYFSLSANTWSTARVGITDFGPDGVLGGGDDTMLTVGNMADTPVLAYITTGPGIGSRIGRQYDGSVWPASFADEDLFEEYSKQWGSLVHDYRLDWQVNYLKGDESRSLALQAATIYTAIPEPSSAFYLVACSLLVFARRQRVHSVGS